MSDQEDWAARYWLPASEAARLDGLDERTVRNRCRQGVNGGYVWRLGSSGDKEIRLSSLSHSAVELYKREQLPDVKPLPSREDPAEFYNLRRSSTSKKKEFCDNWTRVLQYFSGRRGTKNLHAQVALWNKCDSFKISVSNLYRRLKEYRDNGGDRSFLLLKERHVPQTSVKEQWRRDFEDVYLSQPPKSVSSCRLYALGCARQRGEDVESFPSESSFNRVAKKIDREIADAARLGMKKHYDKDSCYVMRDYSMVQAGSCWVGDTRIFDVLVKVPGFDNPKRPYITAFIDLKTSKPLGWHIHHTAPSTENTLRALKHGMARHGIPEILLLDNGREYKNKNFAGQSRCKIDYSSDRPKMWQSAASIFNIAMQFALPGNPRAKPIEGEFGKIKDNFDKKFKAYFGGNSVERPEQLKTLKDKDYVSLADFKDYADRYLANIHPYLKTDSIKHDYSSRQEAWDILYSQRAEPLKAASQASLDELVTLTKDCCINRNGATVSELGVSWWAEWMSGRRGEWIVVRYDPENLKRAWGYEADGKLIGEMETIDAVPAMIKLLPAEEQDYSQAKLGEAMARWQKDKKTVRGLARRNDVGERQIFDALEYALHGEPKSKVGNEAISPIAPIAVTRHDMDREKLKKEFERGNPDILDRMFG